MAHISIAKYTGNIRVCGMTIATADAHTPRQVYMRIISVDVRPVAKPLNAERRSVRGRKTDEAENNAAATVNFRFCDNPFFITVHTGTFPENDEDM